jgi:transcription elongation factor SPT5
LAAFTLSTDRGCIYIEADLTKDLRDILRRTPGLMRAQGNPIYKFIPPSDRIRVLRLPKDKELQFEVGQWVRVLKGVYKGDVGYINGLLPWGGVRLLMVPRIRPPDLSTRKRGNLKRPRFTPPPLTLFDPLVITKTFRVVLKKKGNIHMFNGDKFENGLLIKDFSASAVSSASVFISSEAHSLFLKSQHRTILESDHAVKIPNPAEWRFSTDELVVVLPDEKPFKRIGLGHIRNVDSKYVEVELVSGELGNFRVKWYNILKRFEVGDFVKVVGGMHSGRMGFVDHVDGPDISISETFGAEVLYFYTENLLRIDLLRS